MSTRMLLEGSDIRALLQQVRDDHGPEARIVHAERVRAGGIGGFFAKQRYEVTVELDGSADLGPLDSEAIAASFDDVSEAEPLVASGPDTFTRTPRAATPSTARIEPLEALESVDPTRRIASVTSSEQAAEARTWTPDALPAPRAPLAPQPGPVHAPGIPAGDAVELVLEALGDPDAARTLRPVGPAAQARPLPSLVPPALTDPFTPIASQVVSSLGGAPTGPFRTTAPGEEPTPLFDLGAWVESRQVALAEASAARTSATPLAADPTVGGPALAHAAGMAALAGLAATAAQSAPTAATPIAEQVLATVTPLHVVEPVATPAVAGIPTVPRRPGDLLVLVGDATPAYDVARTLAGGMRVPAESVVVVAHQPVVPGLAEERRLVDALEARLHGAQLAMARTPGVVVVDAPASLVADPLGQQWVGEVVEALGATAVWAVVDATRRTDDLEAWLRVLPPVEALAAHSVAATSRPEEIHHLSVPVSVVDGRPVSTAGTARADASDTLRRTS